MTAGPAFAQYYGEIQFDSSMIPLRVVPYVGDTACGRQSNGFQGVGSVGYHVVVDPEELQPGCGSDGAIVRFVLVSEGNADIDLGTEQWHANDIVERALVDLTASEPPP